MTQEEIFALADQLKEAKQEKKDLESQTKELTGKIEILDAQLSQAMTDAEVEKFTRNGSTFYLNTKLFASAKAGNKDELIAALKANGYGDLVKETVNSNTLNSFCKEQMEANEDELPDWLEPVLNTFEKTTVGIRKK